MPCSLSSALLRAAISVCLVKHKLVRVEPKTKGLLPCPRRVVTNPTEVALHQFACRLVGTLCHQGGADAAFR